MKRTFWKWSRCACHSMAAFPFRLAEADPKRWILDQVHPDLILLDVMMPRMDGPATLAAIRTIEAARDIPVIFMTARVQGSEVEQYLKLGAIGVVPKPFDPVTLASEIRKAFDARPNRTGAGAA